MKTIFLISIFCIGMPFLIFSQESKLPEPEGNFSAIITTNIDNSITWYSNTLGFKIINKTENIERGFKQANLKTGKVWIELIELKNVLAQENILKDKPKGTKISGFFKFGMQVSAFNDWIIHLKKLNTEFLGTVVTDKLSGKKMVLIKDPDGNRIQIFEK
ncbi:VOC family protein [Aquimarina sp. 2201CG14-23]|uniref:VOC family protein n=1 Tax=Aquimarina mycalae TaxID=3040073 RepID=UPI0024780246|nr:VOC family protein [Aquimarina sp. 2201CG14-23]MDH7446529.1 VOC family protein [Aquimarina sp. 2201CG14-23]